MIDHAAAKFTRVDCLINNAGLAAPSVGIAESDVATFDQVIAVNVRSVFLGIKYVAPIMVSQRAGSIINIASIAGLRGALAGHAYATAKGAVHALTRSAAAELGEQGVRVNSISPGGIVTGIFGKAVGVEGAAAERITQVVAELFTNIQPIPRAGVTEDIARACLYFASDAAGFVNGHDLVIDGGLTATTRGWSEMIAFRTGMVERIKDAAAKLSNT